MLPIVANCKAATALHSLAPIQRLDDTPLRRFAQVTMVEAPCCVSGNCYYNILPCSVSVSVSVLPLPFSQLVVVVVAVARVAFDNNIKLVCATFPTLPPSSPVEPAKFAIKF